jgi:hypothetical protein
MAQNRVTRGVAAVGALAVNTGTVVKNIKYGSASLNPDSISGNSTGTVTATITGAATGDIVIVNPPALTTGLGFAGAAITSANTLTIYLVNATANPINNAAATFNWVWIDLT